MFELHFLDGFRSVCTYPNKILYRSSYVHSITCSKGSRKNSIVRLPKKFSKSQVPGTEMKFIAVEK